MAAARARRSPATTCVVAPPAELRRLAVPDEPPAGADLVVDTDGRTVADLVAAVREGLRW